MGTIFPNLTPSKGGRKGSNGVLLDLSCTLKTTFITLVVQVVLITVLKKHYRVMSLLHSSIR